MKRLISVLFVVGMLIFCIIGASMQTEATTEEVTLTQYASAQLTIQITSFKRIMNYEPTEEEREFAYKVAYAEAGNEDALGQILVINTAINNMRAQGFENLIEEFTKKGRYSTVIDGQVYLIYRDKCGNKIKKLVTDEMISQDLKEAVDEAFINDYSEELLMQEANRLGISDPKYYEGGSLYFCNPEAISSAKATERMYIKVMFTHGNHVFYRYWDKSEES